MHDKEGDCRTCAGNEWEIRFRRRRGDGGESDSVESVVGIDT